MFPTSLAVAQLGLHWQPIPHPIMNIATDVHFTLPVDSYDKRGALERVQTPLHHIPHCCLGEFSGFEGLFLPKIDDDNDATSTCYNNHWSHHESDNGGGGGRHGHDVSGPRIIRGEEEEEEDNWLFGRVSGNWTTSCIGCCRGSPHSVEVTSVAISHTFASIALSPVFPSHLFTPRNSALMCIPERQPVA